MGPWRAPRGTCPSLGSERQLSGATSGRLCCCPVCCMVEGVLREDPQGHALGSFTILRLAVPQALQAPACHENLVKVGGYILGEFGNLIAGDPRSR